MIPIDCIGLGKDYGSQAVLRDVTFSVDAGMVRALIGANGAGKTTLLKILATLITPSTGQARIGGEDVAGKSERVRKGIGYISSEERSFYWRLTGRQNLRFFAVLQRMNAAQSEERIDSLLGRLGLEKMGNRRFQEYSTGMKQSLAIARGLLHDPPVILADEPTRSLSPEAAMRFYEIIRDEAEKGKAILFASHNLAEVDRLADTFICLDEGRVVAEGKRGDLSMRTGIIRDGSLPVAGRL